MKWSQFSFVYRKQDAEKGGSLRSKEERVGEEEMDRDAHDSEYYPCCSGKCGPWMDGLSPFTSQRSHFSSHRMGAVREWGDEWQMLMTVAPFWGGDAGLLWLGSRRSAPTHRCFCERHGPTGHHQVDVCSVAGEGWCSHSLALSIVTSGQALLWPLWF